MATSLQSSALWPRSPRLWPEYPTSPSRDRYIRPPCAALHPSPSNPVNQRTPCCPSQYTSATLATLHHHQRTAVHSLRRPRSHGRHTRLTASDPSRPGAVTVAAQRIRGGLQAQGVDLAAPRFAIFEPPTRLDRPCEARQASAPRPHQSPPPKRIRAPPPRRPPQAPRRRPAGPRRPDPALPGGPDGGGAPAAAAAALLARDDAELPDGLPRPAGLQPGPDRLLGLRRVGMRHPPLQPPPRRRPPVRVSPREDTRTCPRNRFCFAAMSTRASAGAGMWPGCRAHTPVQELPARRQSARGRLRATPARPGGALMATLHRRPNPRSGSGRRLGGSLVLPARCPGPGRLFDPGPLPA